MDRRRIKRRKFRPSRTWWKSQNTNLWGSQLLQKWQRLRISRSECCPKS